MLKFIKKIFIGPGEEKLTNTPPLYIEASYVSDVKAVWNDLRTPSYGLERIIRLFLVMIQIIYPSFLVRIGARSFSVTTKKIIVDIYVVLKFVFLLLVLIFGWYKHLLIIIFSSYLVSETIFYILGLIFLADIYPSSISFTRSMLMLIFNYLQVSLGFAIVYIGLNLLNKTLSPLSAIYFSLVTTTTLGLGDYFPSSTFGQVVVILQLLIFILFIVLFINYFSIKMTQKAHVLSGGPTNKQERE